jgi:hypothetical protein
VKISIQLSRALQKPSLLLAVSGAKFWPPAAAGNAMTIKRPAYFSDNAPDQLQLIHYEQLEIAEGRERGDRRDWTGVALSGGGIRSAIFCLGALQALAAKGLLGNFDYISSVSGGGFTASSLQWYFHTNSESGVTKANFPYGASKASVTSDTENDKRLNYLRSHGQYLAPGGGISIWSGLAVVLRTVFLNLAVWIPIGALVLLLLMAPFVIVESYSSALDWVPNVFSVFMQPAWNTHCGDKETCQWPLELFFEVCFIAGMLIMLFFAVWAIAFSPDTRFSAGQVSGKHPRRTFIFAALTIVFFVLLVSSGSLALVYESEPTPLILVPMALSEAFFLIFGWLTLLQTHGQYASANYAWRRRFEVTAGKYFPWTIVIFAASTLPIIPYLLINNSAPFTKAILAISAPASGLISAIIGQNAQSQRKTPSHASSWIAMVASAVFLYSVALISYAFAELMLHPEVLSSLAGKGQHIVQSIVFATMVIAIFLAIATNVNYVGLHRFYRDRLMEALMPDSEHVENNTVGASPKADSLSMSALWPPSGTNGAKRAIPYPIINTNCILINDSLRKIARRGGDNFIISPLYVGCGATGWEDTARHILKHGPLTLPTAMAASGAALSENAAYVGAGITRDRLVSIVLVLLNMRLGLWVGRPSSDAPLGRPSTPNQFIPTLVYGMMRGGYESKSKFMELSDGGHFDNLGVYELIRRRLSVILVIDGEQDNAMAMPALYSVAQRVEEDFKAKIKLDDRLNDLVLTAGKGYPRGAEYVSCPYFVAPIEYADSPAGVLIYVKLSLIESAGFGAKGYRAQNPDFPQQSTANQFFIPEQVEAYRQVGFENMETAIQALDLQPGKFDGGSILASYDKRNKVADQNRLGTEQKA